MQNRVCRWGILFLFYLLCLEATAVEIRYMYRVQLIDKEGTPFSVEEPERFLSKRAIERREKQNVRIDETDLPITPYYIEEILACGAQLVAASKWNNTVVVGFRDTLLAQQVAVLPHVKEVKKVWVAPEIAVTETGNRKEGVTNDAKKYDAFYGAAQGQIEMHRGEKLHKAGFWGEGMHVAVIDAGFYNTDVIKAFDAMDLLGVRDFVHADSDIYAQNYHGMKVLSCMAAYLPNSLVGTAPRASYWLLRSEDEASEQPVEEDYWAAAIEFADSVGVDVVNTSLGYYEFDAGWKHYTYKDLDGHTSLMSHTASMVAGKGMVLVCSAGNTGAKSWKKITPPADAKDVLVVGAVNQRQVNADFSSVGNTADGRVKPDVMAVGLRTSIMENNGMISQGNGTSFASPIICGLVTCLWQACPWLTAYEVIDLVRNAGDRANYPDNIFGCGIPDIWKAYETVMDGKQEEEDATRIANLTPQ